METRKSLAFLENKILTLELELNQAYHDVKDKDLIIKTQANQLKILEETHKKDLEEIELLTYTNKKALQDLRNTKLLLVKYESSTRNSTNSTCQTENSNDQLPTATAIDQIRHGLHNFNISRGLIEDTCDLAEEMATELQNDDSEVKTNDYNKSISRKRSKNVEIQTQKQTNNFSETVQTVDSNIFKIHKYSGIQTERSRFNTDAEVQTVDNTRIYKYTGVQTEGRSENSGIKQNEEIKNNSSSSIASQSDFVKTNETRKLRRSLSPVLEMKESERISLLEKECESLKNSLNKVRKSFSITKNKLSDAQLMITKVSSDAEMKKLENDKFRNILGDYEKQFCSLASNIEAAMGKVKCFNKTPTETKHQQLVYKPMPNILDYFTYFLDFMDETETEKQSLFNKCQQQEKQLNEFSSENELLRKKIRDTSKNLTTELLKSISSSDSEDNTRLDALTENAILTELKQLVGIATNEDEAIDLDVSDKPVACVIRKVFVKLKAYFQVQIDEINLLRDQIEILEKQRKDFHRMSDEYKNVKREKESCDLKISKLVKREKELREDLSKISEGFNAIKRDKDFFVHEINALLKKPLLDSDCTVENFETQIKSALKILFSSKTGEDLEKLRKTEKSYIDIMQATAIEIVQLMVHSGYKDDLTSYNFTDENMVQQIKTICSKIKLGYANQMQQQHNKIRELDNIQSKFENTLQIFFTEMNYCLKKVNIQEIQNEIHVDENIDLQIMKVFGALQRGINALENNNKFKESFVKEKSDFAQITKNMFKQMISLVGTDIGFIDEAEYDINNFNEIFTLINLAFQTKLDEFKELQLQRDSLLKQNCSYKKKIVRLEDLNNNMKHTIDELRVDNNNSNQSNYFKSKFVHLKELELENNDFKKNLHELQLQKDDLSKQNDEFIKKIEGLEFRNNELKMKSDHLKEFERENNALREKLVELKDLQFQNNVLRKTIEELKYVESHNDDLTKKIEELKELMLENDDFKMKMKDLNGVDLESEDFKKVIEDFKEFTLQKNEFREESDMDIAYNDFKNMIENFIKLKLQNNAFRKKVENLTEAQLQNDKFNTKIEGLRALEFQRNELLMQNSDLREKVERFKRCERENIDFKKKLEELGFQSNNLKKLLEDLKQLKLQNNVYTNKIDGVCTDYERKLENVNNDYKKKIEEIKQLKLQNEYLKKQTEELKELDLQNCSLMKEAEELKEKINEFKKCNEELMLQNNDLRNKIEYGLPSKSFKKKMEDITNLELERDELLRENNEFKKKIEELEDFERKNNNFKKIIEEFQQFELQINNKDFKRKLEDLAKLELQKDELLMQNNELAKKVAVIELQNNELKKKMKELNELEIKINLFRKEIEELKEFRLQNNEIKKNIEELKEFEIQNNEMKKKIDELKQLKLQNHEFRTKIEELKQVQLKNNEFETKISMLMNLVLKRSKIESATEIDCQRNENNEFKNIIEDFKLEKANFLKQIDEFKTKMKDLIDLQMQNDQLLKQNDEFKTNMSELKQLQLEKHELIKENNEIKTNMAEMKQLKLEKVELIKENTEIRTKIVEIKQLELEKVELLKENNEIKTKLVEMKQLQLEKVELMKENSDIKTKMVEMKQLQLEKVELIKENNTIKTKLVDMKQLQLEKDELIEENNAIKTKLVEIKQLQLEKDEIIEENNAIKTKLVEMKKLQLEKDELLEENYAIKAKLVGMKQLQLEKDELFKQCSDLKKEIELLQLKQFTEDDLHDLIISVKENQCIFKKGIVEKMFREIKLIKSEEYDKVISKYESVKTTVEILRKENEEFRMEHFALEREFCCITKKENCGDLLQELKLLRKRFDNLSFDLQEVNENIVQVKTLVDKIRSVIYEKGIVNEYKQPLQGLVEQLNDVLFKVKKIVFDLKDINSYRNKYEKLVREIKYLLNILEFENKLETKDAAESFKFGNKHEIENEEINLIRMHFENIIIQIAREKKHNREINVELDNVKKDKLNISAVNKIMVQFLSKVSDLEDDALRCRLKTFMNNRVDNIAEIESILANIYAERESKDSLEARIEKLQIVLNETTRENNTLIDEKHLLEKFLLELNDMNQILNINECSKDVGSVKAAFAKIRKTVETSNMYKVCLKKLYAAIDYPYDEFNTSEGALVEAFSVLEKKIISEFRLKTMENDNLREELQITKNRVLIENKKMDDNSQQIIQQLRDQVKVLEQKIAENAEKIIVEKCAGNAALAASLRNKYSDLIEEYRDQNSQLEKQNDLMKEHISVIMEYKKKLKECDKTIRELRCEVGKLNQLYADEVNNKQNVENEMREKVSGLNGEIKKILVRMEDVLSENEGLEKQISNLKSVNCTLKNSIATLQGEIDKYAEEMRLLEMKNQNSEKELKMVINMVEAKTKGDAEKDFNILELKRTCERYEAWQKENKQKLQELEGKLSKERDWEERMVKLREERDNLEKQLNSNDEEWQNKIINTNNQLMTLSDPRSEFNKHSGGLELNVAGYSDKREVKLNYINVETFQNHNVQRQSAQVHYLKMEMHQNNIPEVQQNETKLQLECINEENHELRNQLEAMKTEVNDLKEREKYLLQENEELNKSKIESDALHDKINADLEETKERVKTLTCENDNLRNNLSESNEKLMNLLYEKKDFEDKLTRSNANLNNLEDQMNKVVKQYEELTKCNVNLNELQDLLIEVINENEELESKIKQANTCFTQNKLDDPQEVEIINYDLIRERIQESRVLNAGELNAYLQDALKQNKEMRNRLTFIQSNERQLNETNLCTSLDNLKIENQKLTESNNSLNQGREYLKKENEKLREYNSNLNLLEVLKKENENLKESNANFIQNEQYLISENEKLKGINMNLNQVELHLRREIEKLKESNFNMNQVEVSLRREIEKQKELNSILNQVEGSLRRETHLNQVEERLTQVLQEKSEVEKNISQLRNEKLELQIAISQLKLVDADKDKLQLKLNTVIIENKRLKEDLTVEKRLLNVEISALKDTILNLQKGKSEIKLSAAEYENFKIKFNKINDKLDDYLKDKAEYQRDFDYLKNNLFEEITRLRRKVVACDDLEADFHIVMKSHNVHEQIHSLRCFIQKRDAHAKILLQQKLEATKLLNILLAKCEKGSNFEAGVNVVETGAQNNVEDVAGNIGRHDERYNQMNTEIMKNEQYLREKLKALDNKKNTLQESFQKVSESDLHFQRGR